MLATTTVTAPASEGSSAESGIERMKRAAAKKIDDAAKITGNAAVSAIDYCHQHKEQVKQAGEACGAVGGAAVGTAIAVETGCSAVPVVPITTGAGKVVGGKAAECAVDGCHNHVAPRVPDCCQQTADCTGKAAGKGIDCVADSAGACAQGTRNLTNRVSSCFK